MSWDDGPWVMFSELFENKSRQFDSSVEFLGFEGLIDVEFDLFGFFVFSFFGETLDECSSFNDSLWPELSEFVKDSGVSET